MPLLAFHNFEVCIIFCPPQVNNVTIVSGSKRDSLHSRLFKDCSNCNLSCFLLFDFLGPLSETKPERETERKSEREYANKERERERVPCWQTWLSRESLICTVRESGWSKITTEPKEPKSCLINNGRERSFLGDNINETYRWAEARFLEGSYSCEQLAPTVIFSRFNTHFHSPSSHTLLGTSWLKKIKRHRPPDE